MNLMRDADLSKLRIKKKAWMQESNYNITLAFTDNDADVLPRHSSLPPYEAHTLSLGQNPAQEANAPN